MIVKQTSQINILTIKLLKNNISIICFTIIFLKLFTIDYHHKNPKEIWTYHVINFFIRIITNWPRAKTKLIIPTIPKGGKYIKTINKRIKFE